VGHSGTSKWAWNGFL